MDNLVIMGMGEPLANYENLLRALQILNAPWAAALARADHDLYQRPGANPAAAKSWSNSGSRFRCTYRRRPFPDHARQPQFARELTAAGILSGCKGRRLTFEYILIAGVNDGLEQVRPLAALARRLRAKINLIPYNVVEGLAWSRPSERVCDAFLHALQKEKISVTLRREKGHDIDAACGQLRLKAEQAIRPKQP